MHLPRLSATLLGLAFTLATRPLSAQQQPRAYFTLAANLADHKLSAIGPRKGVVEGLLGVRGFTSRPVGVSASIVGGRSAQLPFGDDLDCPLDSDGGCKPGIPGFAYGGIQLGSEIHYDIFSLSISSGPAAFHFKPYRKVGGTDIAGRRLFPILPATTVLSINTRAEATLQFNRHVGWVFSKTWRHLPQYRGAPYDINGVGTGIRLQ